MKKYYEEELPNDYKIVKSIDAKNSKVGVYLNLFAVLLLVFALGLCLLYLGLSGKMNSITISPILSLIFAVSMIVYIVLHELVHGIIYKLYTKQKLTFGLSWTCAYCGVPNVYVYRFPSIVALLGPFVVFSIVFLLPMFLINDGSISVMFALLFSIHFSGCVGDLYVFMLLLFKYRNKDLLINDTGPKQTFYIK